MDLDTGNLTSVLMRLDSAGTLSAGNLAISGTLSAGNLAISGALAGPIAATGAGVTYPDITTGPGGGGGNHAFGFEWDGSSVRVFVDGSFVGRMTIVYPLAEERP
jgi:hypothetical protein